jgi:hypothetical protein
MHGRLYVAPGRPNPGSSAISKICAELGWSIRAAQTLEDWPVLFWPAHEGVYPPQPPGWINGRCLDIDKDTVEGTFRRVFGYTYAIDPRTHAGPYVKKSITNARHDGVILHEPSEPQEGFAYQIVINNIVENEVEDLRLVYIQGVLDFLFIIRRPIASRFAFRSSFSMLCQTSSRMSESERRSVDEMCHSLGLDYGEIDALRNRDDGKLYVVDVNRTPAGPPRTLTAREKRRALHAMASKFSIAFAEQPRFDVIGGQPPRTQ